LERRLNFSAQLHESLIRARIIVEGQFHRLRELPESELPRALETLLASPAEFKTSLAFLLKETTLLGLLVESGVPGDRGFLGDFWQCVRSKTLPKSVSPRSMEDMLNFLFGQKEDRDWCRRLQPETWSSLGSSILLHLGTEWLEAFRDEFLDALELLSYSVSSIAHSGSLRTYFEKTFEGNVAFSIRSSPFYRLQRCVRRSLESGDLTLLESKNDFLEEWAGAVQFLDTLESKMETIGVSIDVVSRIQTISLALNRMEQLFQILSSPGDTKKTVCFLIKLLELRESDLSFSGTFKIHLSTLARKITEHASARGRNYITNTSRQFGAMFLSAAGAGAFTALTCLAKFAITSQSLAPFWETAFIALNYTLSFLVLQHLGLSLATKQSSMTAAHLADALSQAAETRDHLLGSLSARIARSQFAAALGNVLSVVPTAAAIYALFVFGMGIPIVDSVKAAKTLAAFDVLNPTLWFFAALTGVLLWISSFCAGFVENLVVYHRIVPTLEQKSFAWRLQHPFLSRGVLQFSKSLKKHGGGWGGNVSLGTLLALPSFFGRILGFSWDVRHVTLGAGAVTFASLSLYQSASHFASHLEVSLATLRAALGVVLVGVLNVGVSFFCSLMIAMLARNEHWRSTFSILRLIYAHFKSNPKRYFFPSDQNIR
jgi:site-specific recombinase